ncbi:hypothetical protein VZT92_011825 [Zoarces viviparus]|uniref:Uncharacterized protein n=1 Tax=Zoarces viviparus TaxID=48416 RepID=A0AAW1F602_ZOAVI
MITRCQPPPVNSQVPAEAIRGEASLELLCFGLVCVGSGLEGPERRGASSSTGCLNTDTLDENQRGLSLPLSSLLPNTAGWAAASYRGSHLSLIKHISDRRAE